MENAPTPVTVVQQNSSGCKIAAIVLGVILLLGGLLVGGCFFLGFMGVKDAVENAKKRADEQANIAGNLEILDFSWRNVAGVNVMEADFKIRNNNSFDIKDIEIRCDHFAESGTRIDSNTRTIYELIKAGETREFKKFNMGFIHSQARKSVASVVAAEKAE